MINTKKSGALVAVSKTIQAIPIRLGSREGGNSEFQKLRRVVMKVADMALYAVIHPDPFAAVINPAGVFKVGKVS
jgi:hypothetical protein